MTTETRAETETETGAGRRHRLQSRRSTRSTKQRKASHTRAAVLVLIASKDVSRHPLWVLKSNNEGNGVHLPPLYVCRRTLPVPSRFNSRLPVPLHADLRNIDDSSHSFRYDSSSSSSSDYSSSDTDSDERSSSSSRKREKSKKHKHKSKKEKHKSKSKKKKSKHHKKSKKPEKQYSIITGAVIKKKIYQSSEDKRNALNRQQLLQHLNATCQADT